MRGRQGTGLHGRLVGQLVEHGERELLQGAQLGVVVVDRGQFELAQRLEKNTTGWTGGSTTHRSTISPGVTPVHTNRCDHRYTRTGVRTDVSTVHGTPYVRGRPHH